MAPTLLAAVPSGWESLLQYSLIGLSYGLVYALIALGYTMVYGIVELINFAHGDLFMLGTFAGLTVLSVASGLFGYTITEAFVSTTLGASIGLVLLLVFVPLFCGALNWSVDKVVYRPLRSSPKLVSLVSAVGVSFVMMNIGLFWNGAVYEESRWNEAQATYETRRPVAAASPRAFPELISSDTIIEVPGLRVTAKELLVVGVTVPAMLLLTYLVRYTTLGKAMRATAQNPTAARLMGIDVDRVIGLTFWIGGALGGVSSVVYVLYFNKTSFQEGFTNGLYAFTAAVLGGIGNIPGAVLGGLVIGLVRSLGSAYVGDNWTGAFVFGILILLLVFRPTGLLGSRTREKV